MASSALGNPPSSKHNGARAAARPITVVELDPRLFEPAADTLHELAPRVVLLIDSYEHLRLLDSWIRQNFVPSLHDSVRVVEPAGTRPTPRSSSSQSGKATSPPSRSGLSITRRVPRTPPPPRLSRSRHRGRRPHRQGPSVVTLPRVHANPAPSRPTLSRRRRIR